MEFLNDFFWSDHNKHIIYRFSGLFYSDHSKYSVYSNEHLNRAWDRALDRSIAKWDEYKALKNQVDANFENAKKHYEENINRLKNEKYYPALNTASPENLVEAVKADMRREIEDSISRDKQEIAEIDKMISRINELEQQAKRA